MKRIIAIIMTCSLFLTACGQSTVPTTSLSQEVTEAHVTQPTKQINETTDTDESPTIETSTQEVTAVIDKVTSEDPEVEFNDLSDSALLRYLQDNISSGLAAEFSSEDYIIENVIAIYYSKEYLEELAYNSKANIFFGFTLEELDEQFQGNKYVFTLGENGETVVQPFEDYDDTYEQVIKNVAIGTGVILICVTVSVVTGGAGLAPVSMVFAASAKTATTMALSSGAFSAIAAGTVEGIRTGDFDKAVKAAALAGSESFKWGAITGAIAGGVSEANALRNASKASEVAEHATVVDDGIPNWRDSELKVLEQYGGKEQVSFLDGVEVPKNTPGATRPDVLTTVGDHLEAIEVKNYDLTKVANRSELYSELEREVTARIANLPKGSTQRIVLDVTGRDFGAELIEKVTETISIRLSEIYPNIPIDIMGL